MEQRSQPASTAVQQPRQDGVFLHFLKELPAWCVILSAFVFLVSMWYVTGGNDFLQRMMDAALGALLTSLVSNRLRTPITQVSANKIETGAVNPTLTDSAGDETDGDKR